MIKVKKVRPLLNHVITTADRYEEAQMKDGLIDTANPEGEIMNYQRVIALGPNAYSGLNVGDMVLINPKRYMIPEHSLRKGSVEEKREDEVTMYVQWPIVEIDDKECLFLYDSDLEVMIDEWEPDIIS